MSKRLLAVLLLAASATGCAVNPVTGKPDFIVVSEEQELALEFGHLTAAQAAEFAKDAGVGQLFLTHISRRYREREILAEAQSIFPRTSVARDLEQHIIKRPEHR